MHHTQGKPPYSEIVFKQMEYTTTQQATLFFLPKLHERVQSQRYIDTGNSSELCFQESTDQLEPDCRAGSRGAPAPDHECDWASSIRSRESHIHTRDIPNTS